MTRPDDPGPVRLAAAERRRRTGAAAGVAIIVAAAATAVVFGLNRGGDEGRLLLAAVALHERQAAGPVPAPLPDEAETRASFSRNARGAGWVPAGAREDRLDGRAAVTVIWQRGGRRMAHTVVSGAPLQPPEGARRTGRRGVLLHSFEAGPRIAVSWPQRRGTSVISAVGVSRGALYDLAGGRPVDRGR
jgi:hypothetical protein